MFLGEDYFFRFLLSKDYDCTHFDRVITKLLPMYFEFGTLLQQFKHVGKPSYMRGVKLSNSQQTDPREYVYVYLRMGSLHNHE